MSKRRILYLPIETKARELLGKTFLAARAVARGWIVVTGQQSDIHNLMKESPAGAYIEISIPELKAARLEQMSKAGHRIANLCEESLQYWHGRDYCHMKLGIGSLRWVDRLLVIGAKNAEDICAFRPQFADKIAVTGNPRFDTLLSPLRRVYGLKAETIRNRYGRFLLVNTNFGGPNPYRLEKDQVERLKRMGMIMDDDHADFVRRNSEYQTRRMNSMQAMLKELASSGVVDRIILRPHPGEDHQVWRDWGTPLGIDIIYEGTAIEWILAAEAMVHPGCTTGIEGTLLDRPVFSFVPEPGLEFMKLSDQVSQQVVSAEDFAARLKEIGSARQEGSRLHLSSEHARLSNYVANTEPPFAADKILDELDGFDLPTFTAEEVRPPNRNSLSQYSRAFRKVFRNCLNAPIPPQSIPRKLQKFPGVNLSEFIQPLDIWCQDRILNKQPRVSSSDGRLYIWH